MLSKESMSSDEMNNWNESEEEIRKYLLDKLDSSGKKSRFHQIIHGAHIHRDLRKKCRHLSKNNSISEDLIKERITQVMNDIDEYVTEFSRIISSEKFQSLNCVFNPNQIKNNGWYQLQLKRAQQLFPIIDKNKNESFDENDLLEKYSSYVENKYTPKKDSINSDQLEKFNENHFNLNEAYDDAQTKAKEFLKNFFKKIQNRQTPNVKIIDEIIQLGRKNMKKIPSKEDFEKKRNLFDRIRLFGRIKQSYEYLLNSTGDDFLILRFGRQLGSNSLSDTSIFNKQFIYLLHLFLKSLLKFFGLLTMNRKDINLSSLSELDKLLFNTNDYKSIKRFDFDLLSPECSIDQWTWLLEQWRDVLRTMPLILTRTGAFSRLVRTTIGIALMYLGQCAEGIVNQEDLILNSQRINEELFHSLQIGFYFGISYSIVDSLQDEINLRDRTFLKNFLTFNSNKDVSLNLNEYVDQWILIMEQFLSGNDFDRNQLPKTSITTILIKTFDNLRILIQFNDKTFKSFNQLALLLRSQRIDQKQFNQQYHNEQLYLGSVLKSHFTYKCAAYLGNMMSACFESDRLWSIPFLGQLTDDCRDFNDDFNSLSVTPYTYYAKLNENNQDIEKKNLMNPFELFLNLCLDLYITSGKDIQTGAFLGRRILRTLRSIEMTKDQYSYEQFLKRFCQKNCSLYNYCLNKLPRYFSSVTDPEKEFFRQLDCLSIRYSRTNRKLETYVAENLPQIEEALQIDHPVIDQNFSFDDKDLLISGMNYSVQAGGKRLRMLLLFLIADLYRIESERIFPLACGIEYFHTSSLIFDDLPAQDNSHLRRGRETLHQTTINEQIPQSLCEGRAQIAAVSLIAVSMKKISHGLAQNGFSSPNINRIVDEISQLMHSLSIGQMMDLRAARFGLKQTNQQLEELDRIAWLKTGKTIEAVLVTPVILSDLPFNQQLIHIDQLRQLARLLGILFQMRDDLLDIEATDTIGKPTSLDLQNNTVTYVALLGVQQTRQRLQLYLTQTLQLVDQLWPNDAQTVKDVVQHIVSRKS